MLDLNLAELVQMRVPPRKRREIIGHALGQQNVARIAAIHHPLRHVDPGPGDIHTIVDINDFVYRAAVNAHAQLDAGVRA